MTQQNVILLFTSCFVSCLLMVGCSSRDGGAEPDAATSADVAGDTNSADSATVDSILMDTAGEDVSGTDAPSTDANGRDEAFVDAGGLPLGEQCSATSECNPPAMCEFVGTLVDMTCCMGEGVPCSDHIDCCGAALCEDAGDGFRCLTCSVVGHDCGNDHPDCCPGTACTGPAYEGGTGSCEAL